VTRFRPKKLESSLAGNFFGLKKLENSPERTVERQLYCRSEHYRICNPAIDS
jgi:hypothetical protein